MKYELKGRLLDLAQSHAQQYSDWHVEVLGKLQELEPRTNGYILSTSVWTGGRVSGIVTKPDVVLEKWRKGAGPGWWTPNKRFSIGKNADNVIRELPVEPDLAATIMAALGFKTRYFAVGSYRYSAPGFTCLPKTKKAFIHWDPKYPQVNDPDMEEVLESYYHQAVERAGAVESTP